MTNNGDVNEQIVDLAVATVSGHDGNDVTYSPSSIQTNAQLALARKQYVISVTVRDNADNSASCNFMVVLKREYIAN